MGLLERQFIKDHFTLAYSINLQIELSIIFLHDMNSFNAYIALDSREDGKPLSLNVTASFCVTDLLLMPVTSQK